MISSSILYSALLFLLCLSTCQSFTTSQRTARVNTPATPSSTAVQYQNEAPVGNTATLEQPLPVRKPNIPKPSKRTKIFVEEIMSLNDLRWFLEEDERPVVIKFYAKWCKKCQRLGQHFDRLAMEMGDRVVDQQMVDGDVRFAAVEYNQESHDFITEELQIRGFPTLQMYVGTKKLLEGGSSIKNVRKELAVIDEISHQELILRAEEADDGVLEGLIEESFFDSPDFLNEEW